MDAHEFRRRVGLTTDVPLLLYVCSSKFIAPDEPAFVERWLRALRACGDERLRAACVLIRPHPTTGGDWERSRLADLPDVAVWPRRGEVHVDAAEDSAFFDSIYHSRAVVGVNTSALIETAIVGRPVFTVLDADFAATQEGTLHFHYLLRENGGPLTVASDSPSTSTSSQTRCAKSVRRSGERGPSCTASCDRAASSVRPRR